MLATRLLSSAVLLSLMATPAISQTTTQIARTDNQKQVKRDVAPLPNDPLELATGPTATVTTPQQRLAVTKLLQQARRNMVLHAIGERPFTLKLSFTSSGHPRYTGSGELEEAWANGQSWRWSAQLGDYSQQRVFSDGFAYDVKSPGAIPLRFQMVRSAVFNAMPIRPPQGLMRVATAKWQGTDLMCVLLSGPNNDPAPTPGRRWVETEHCVDPTTGLLHLWSEAPGIYVVYNYADALHFHGKTVPRQISVVEGGTEVLDIHVDSLEDGAGDPALLKPTPDMLANGPGTLMERVMRFPQFIRNVPKGASEIKVEPVIVHAIIDEHGKVIDAEALQNTNPTLSQTAVKFVEDSTYPHQAPGTVPRQREAFINVRFATGG